MDKLTINTKVKNGFSSKKLTDSPKFMEWMENRRAARKKKRMALKKILHKKELKMKFLAFKKLKNNKYNDWCIFKQQYKHYAGKKPSLSLKRWFFEKSPENYLLPSPHGRHF
tara:strand:+ start:231 stop:566 length:336 start_codon:yes stop_codon:yes gene_type:complete